MRWSRFFGQCVKVYANGGTGASEMAKRRWFTPRFKAQVALGGAAGRADSATDRGAAWGASEPGEPVEAQGARGARVELLALGGQKGKPLPQEEARIKVLQTFLRIAINC